MADRYDNVIGGKSIHRPNSISCTTRNHNGKNGAQFDYTMARVFIKTVTGEMNKIINEIDYVHMKYLCHYFIGQKVLYYQVGGMLLITSKIDYNIGQEVYCNVWVYYN